ncbi:XTP/dITP diphosphohydrolase [Nonlabens sp. Hel1_33_55]|uniref:RdgB/HAM1 family non-canonical purine NTP pyrophosphatase n=1 Tax=Nonlabens sp. Hel1_33_55 TaxID=1336802 RepID=UPI000875D807|nr:RdgB/HAM1 family non-canonical purine NTP pyrophosphatase [Nonlabens sp. Hel1_33_55]SCX95396.1 XTP/dITP diphosphohydrolase [Nonlabens sp. Hel1_33_55]
MELIFATHNPNKLKEVQQMMPKSIKLLSLEDVQLFDEIPETAATIKENAILKTDYIKARFDMPVFADDTGLIVPALDGNPGVRSARYAGEHKDSEDNMDLLLKNLTGDKDRSAYFLTVISLFMDGQQFIFEGRCNGMILHQRQGEKGFGYDPIFQPDGYQKSFAQMDMNQKSIISHRGKALKKLISHLNGIKIV